MYTKMGRKSAIGTRGVNWLLLLAYTCTYIHLCKHKARTPAPHTTHLTPPPATAPPPPRIARKGISYINMYYMRVSVVPRWMDDFQCLSGGTLCHWAEEANILKFSADSDRKLAHVRNKRRLWAQSRANFVEYLRTRADWYSSSIRATSMRVYKRCTDKVYIRRPDVIVGKSCCGFW